MLQSASGVKARAARSPTPSAEFQTQHNEGSGTKIGVDGKAGAETSARSRVTSRPRPDKDLKLDDKERDRFRAFMGTRGPETPASREVPRDAVSGAQVGGALRAGEASARHVLECANREAGRRRPVAAAAGAPGAPQARRRCRWRRRGRQGRRQARRRRAGGRVAGRQPPRAEPARPAHLAGRRRPGGGAWRRGQRALPAGPRRQRRARAHLRPRRRGKILANERFDASKVKGVTVDAGDSGVIESSSAACAAWTAR